MDILVLSGSTRAESLNTRLAGLVADSLPGHDVRIDAGLARLPFYDADVEAAAVPQEVSGLRAAVAGADVVVITSPEYNGTTPGVLVNALDWLSRPHGASALIGKPVLALTAAPGPRGGTRALAHLTALLGTIGARVVGGGLSVPRAGQRLTTEGLPELRAELAPLLQAALDLAAPADGAETAA
ncbi:NAD(P)H-dependent FMN reductase [Kineococcus xinjiangensis]|uniref:NAD(P)H-dependent FMN reductase n=1 Tax=Kineococcus xinjiangensis TaxID=512762 RepID=A0A2S6IVK2_9ACTN|nr:NAD(P)H-dependent oxidoreductase [Kineococcus xinjiangensis]PPK98353.1 NAD(P)H-dependent FMN reductase [Kineococcus xinjiangensis]